MSQQTTTTPAPAVQLAMLALSADHGRLSPPLFHKFKSYVLFVDQTVDAVRVTIDSGDATLSINGQPTPSGQPSAPIAVSPGRTSVAITLTSPDGSASRSYTVFVHKALPTPAWKKVSDSAPFLPRDSAGELVFDNHMWLFGGYTPKVISDVWRSPDGQSWEKMPDIPDPAGVNVPIRFVLDGFMWLTTNSNAYIRSGDGITWETIEKPMPWASRSAAGSVVFNGRAWIMGGISRDTGKRLNDVWSSSDGIHWRQETPTAPWSPRQLHDNVVAFNNRLWVIGGGIQNYHPFKAYRDVWSSPDGIQWDLATDQAPWPPRFWASTAVYKGQMWLFGGFRSEPKMENFADVWHSPDGITWRQFDTDAAWSARHEVSPYVFNDKLWIVAGNAWPLVNDTWSLHIPGLTFLTSPSNEEYLGAQYTYRPHACFNASGAPVQYRLLQAPAWLSISDPACGVLQGTPQTSGAYDVTLEAFDQAGQTARQSFTIHVL
jgi:hypothetical protein